jgi:hypothetical protein
MTPAQRARRAVQRALLLGVLVAIAAGVLVAAIGAGAVIFATEGP